MSLFDWFEEYFRSGPTEGGIGGGSSGAFAIGQWSANVPYIGPYLGLYLTGRDDLSSLTPGDEGFARSEVYERQAGSATWKLVFAGDTVPGLEPGVIDFTGSPPRSLIDSWTSPPDVGARTSGRQYLRNPNLLADNADHRIWVETSIWLPERGGEIGGRPEIRFSSRSELTPTIDAATSTAPPSNTIDEVIVRGVRPDRSPPSHGNPSAMPVGVPEGRPHVPAPPSVNRVWPAIGESILDALGNMPGSPLSLWKDYKIAAEMARAFDAEKDAVSGTAMALNVLNPLFAAEVARFEAGEAADRGDSAKATAYQLRAALGYVQTLVMAVGAARGISRLGPAPVASSASRSPSLLSRLRRAEEGSLGGSGSGFEPQYPTPVAPGATRASVPFSSLGRVAEITSKRTFRRFATRSLQDPKNPLHRILDPTTKRLIPSTRKGIGQWDWFEDPRIVEAGHWRSAKGLGGAADKLTIMSAYENRLVSAVVEHPSIGGVMLESGRVVAIGGFPVSLSTAEALVEFGALDAEVLAEAPFVIF